MLSVYLDLQPVGERPEERPDLIKLRARLHLIGQTLWPRGPVYEEFERDIAHVEHYLQEHLPASAQGLALFVASNHQMFWVWPSSEPFTFEVTFRPTPQVYQLTRQIAEHHTALVALRDCQTLRLFTLRYGVLTEVADLSKDAERMRARPSGGSGEFRYERHLLQQQHAHTETMAALIDRYAACEGAEHILLIGQAEDTHALLKALSPTIVDRAMVTSLPLDIESLPTDICHAVLPLLEWLEQDDARVVADRVVEAVQAHGLGVLGREETQAALAQGQVATLVLTADAPLAVEQRDVLTRQAIATDATVEVVEHHDVLDRFGGVGAVLRYRLPPTG
jgi:hypothetical protein